MSGRAAPAVLRAGRPALCLLGAGLAVAGLALPALLGAGHAHGASGHVDGGAGHGPVDAAIGPLTAQVAGHLLTGMAAPLALVLAAPVTLTLRALPVVAARRLTHLLRAPAVRLLSHPVTATAIDLGGLWALFATGLHLRLSAMPWGGVAMAAHMLLAGYLFAEAVVGVDPAPHRSSFRLRAAALLVALTGHATLAKHLYGHPPPGVADDDAAEAGLLMYYGGDAVHLVLLVVFCHQWSRAAARRRGR